MKKLLLIFVLAWFAIAIRSGVFYVLPPYVNTLVINVVGSIIYVYVMSNLRVKDSVKKIVNVAFLGTLTTYSGVYSDIYLLYLNANFSGLMLYFIITFFVIPLITFVFLINLRKDVIE